MSAGAICSGTVYTATRRKADDAEGLVGILSLDDVLELLVEESKDIGHLLRAQEPV